MNPQSESRPAVGVDEVESQPGELRAALAQAQAELAAERAARAKAEQASAQKDSFLSAVSHALRSPLGAILGWAHMLRRRGGEEEFERGLEVIEQSVAAQTRMIDDLLDMGRMVSGRIRIEPEVLEPRSFVAAAIESALPTAAAKRLRIRKLLDLPVGKVRGDPARLQQVVRNLLDNAIRYTAEGGSIEVVLRPADTFAVITVTDSGAGIDPAELPHVFDRFRQEHADAPSHGGLGLGLAMGRHIVGLHGGGIEAHSEGEGRGAAFTVRLPLVD